MLASYAAQPATLDSIMDALRVLLAEREVPAQRLVYTVDEAAAALMVSRGTLYALMSAGDVRYIEVATRGRRIPVDSLRAYIARQLEQTEPAPVPTITYKPRPKTHSISERRARACGPRKKQVS